MGCGSSKLDPNHEAVPPRLRPILRNRIEELKRRSNPTAAKGATLSRKGLLAMESYEMDNSSRSQSNHHSQVNEASLKPRTATLECEDHNKNEESGEPERKTLQLEKDLKAEETFREKEEGNDEKMEDKQREKEEKKFEGKEDENAEDEATISRCLDSPSFRVYCSSDLPEDDGKPYDDGHNDAGTSVEAGIPECQESVHSNEASVKKSASKEKKVGMLRKVALKHKGGKGIWNVRGCYTSRSQHSTHLLEKATA
ncbi:hypothetical protein Ancab_035532 [Ancistrocladus abbreviatus]